MPSLESDKLDQALAGKLGCERDERRDHIFFYLYDGGKVISHTKISHGAKHTIYPQIVSKMAKQLKLSTAGNLVALVTCTLDKDGCLKIIRQA